MRSISRRPLEGRQQQPACGSAHDDDTLERLWDGYAGRLDRLSDTLRRLKAAGARSAAGSLLLRLQQNEIVVFPVGRELWVPRFQFETPELDTPDAVGEAISELQRAFDPVEIALWFCTPNAWLHGQRPMHLVHTAPVAVHGAARADRYCAMG